MNYKSLLISSVAGGIVYFLLGWLFYGIIFKDFFPSSTNDNLLFVFLGCLVSAVLLAFIFLQWASISTAVGGLKAGGLIAFLTALSTNFFMYTNKPLDAKNFVIDLLIALVCGALVGAVIGVIIGKTKT